MSAQLRDDLTELMLVPGLAGHEDRVRRAIAARLPRDPQTDVLGNLWVTFEGDPALPSVMLFTHMDQLGFVVRRIEPSGLIRLERLGGVPERALAAQAVLLCVGEGRDVPGLIA
ncbi:MAG: M42 family peptidase, partial [Pseudomonadota bacterium]